MTDNNYIIPTQGLKNIENVPYTKERKKENKNQDSDRQKKIIESENLQNETNQENPENLSSGDKDENLINYCA